MKYEQFLLRLLDDKFTCVTVAPQTLVEFMKTAWSNEEKVGYFEDGHLAIPYHAVISVQPNALDTSSDSRTA